MGEVGALESELGEPEHAVGTLGGGLCCGQDTGHELSEVRRRPLQRRNAQLLLAGGEVMVSGTPQCV